MISKSTEKAKPNFSKVYSYANTILATSSVISGFPFKVNRLIKEQSDIAVCSFEKALTYGVDIRQFGSESAVLTEYGGEHIIFYNEKEVVYRIRFSILHEYGHYIFKHSRNLKQDDPIYHKQEIEANCFAAQILMPEQIIRECSSRGKYISESFIIESFDVSPDAAQKRLKTLATTIYEWHSRQEREYDDIILLRHMDFINTIAPIGYMTNSFEDDYDKEQERSSWLDTRYCR